ncbi:MAG: hypothetical protein QF437_05705 [Planctomycetota bacterium]|nr:hypothetical protein [Planctomycetota bacterium]MDP7129961.1 hypothetical protein [Planctomycetota bacterium]
MQIATRAIETTGTVDAQQRLLLDEPLPVTGSARVRVIVLFPDEGEVEESDWLKAGADNPAFDFLTDEKEDIYTPADGRPFDDQG